MAAETPLRTAEVPCPSSHAHEDGEKVLFTSIVKTAKVEEGAVSLDAQHVLFDPAPAKVEEDKDDPLRVVTPDQSTCIYLLYDERMTRHAPLNWTSCEKWPNGDEKVPDDYVFENPERVRRLYQRLLDSRLSERFVPLSCQPVTRDTVLLAHSAQHYDEFEQTARMSIEDLETKSKLDDDIYYCPDTFLAASLSCGGVVSCVNSVFGSDTSSRAIAVVRPPGHHACQEKVMGFCYFNSVAVAAKHAIATGRAKRVAIVDWDVHHGNGTQDLTYDDSSIMYISLHRFAERGEEFFPGTGRHTQVADGTNVNIAWTRGGMGNAEYAAAFSELILPLLSEWSPDLILVSCGFDAAKGDLIGDCELTPHAYYCMTRSLLKVCEIPIVVALEGGYNVNVIAECMEAVALALLDEPWDQEQTTDEPHELQSTSLEQARMELVSYWNHHESTFANRGCIRPTAARCLNQTMAAVENASLWSDRITFRRFVQSALEGAVRTRAIRERDEDELIGAFHSLGL